MPVYEYKGVNTTGRNVSGVRDGESLKAMKAKLRSEGVTVLEIREGGGLRAGRTREITFGLGQRVRLDDLAVTTRQLATLLSSGLPLMEALNVLVEQEEKAPLKAALASVRDAVRQGSSLAEGLKQNPRAFSHLYVNMVAAGEASGTLEITLDRLADFLDEQAQFRAKLGAAMVYPAFMSIIGVATLLFIFAFVMPRVTGMFEDMKQQLPLITLILLGIVKFFSMFWWLFLLLLVGAGVYLRKYVATPHGRERLDVLVLRIPAIGSLVKMIAVSRFARTLGTLLEGGVPTLTALDIVQNVVGNTVLADAVRKARENVREGESIADPLRRSGLFPPMVVQMVAVGEKSGELEKMLLKVSDSFDRMIEVRISRFMALLQPVIIVLMAIVVGFVVIAVMLPLLQMSSGIQ